MDKGGFFSSKWRSSRPQWSPIGDPNTLFVDNLPNSAEVPWFRKVFSKFGKVIEAVIPNKRSMKTGNKFGFIRYSSSRSATYAIAQLSGLWIGRRYLVVKKASYGRRRQSNESIQTSFGNNRFGPLQNFQNLTEKGRNTDNLVGDFTQLKELEKRVTISLPPTASEWLWRSAIAELKSVSTPEFINNAFSKMDFRGIQVRTMGGKFMLITFQSIEDRNKALINQSITGWFQSFKHWNGDAASLSRLVWLKIRGMPLNAWELKSFQKIAEIWGEFVTLDLETAHQEAFDVGRLLMVTNCNHKIHEWINVIVKGKNYHVQVWEEECNDPFDIKGVKFTDHQLSNYIEPQLNICKDGASQTMFLADNGNHVSSKSGEGRPIIFNNCGEQSKKTNELAKEDIREEEMVAESSDMGLGPHESAFNEKNGNNTNENVINEALQPKSADDLLGTHAEKAQESPFQILEDIQADNLAQIDCGSKIIKSPPCLEHINIKEPEFPQLPDFIVPKVVRAKKRKELRDLCDTLDELDRVSESCIQQSNSNHQASISSSDIAKRNEVILKELKDAIEVSKTLNVKFHESDEVTLNRMLKLEIEEIKRRQQDIQI